MENKSSLSENEFWADAYLIIKRLVGLRRSFSDRKMAVIMMKFPRIPKRPKMSAIEAPSKVPIRLGSNVTVDNDAPSAPWYNAKLVLNKLT